MNILRFLAAPLVWVHPFIGFLTWVCLNIISSFYTSKSVRPDKKIQWQNTLLDLWFLLWLISYVQLELPPSTTKLLILMAFLFRIIGYALYFTFRQQWIFFFFPSIVTELFGLWLIAPYLLEHYTEFFLIALLMFGLYKERRHEALLSASR